MDLLVRAAWLHGTVSTLQHLIGRWAAPEQPLPDMLVDVIRHLPAATNRAESLLQRALVLQLLLEGDRRHPFARTAADAAFLHGVIEGLVRARPNEGLASVISRVADAAGTDSTSPEALVNRMRAFVDKHFAERLTTAEIARAFRIDPRALQVAFTRRMGRTLRRYVAERRAAAALESLTRDTDVKIEAVALLVGYRSRKNLNAALARFIGMPPRAIRSRPAEAWARFRACVDRRDILCH